MKYLFDIKKYNKIFIFNSFLKIIIFSFIINQTFSDQCPVDKPILLSNGTCVLKYCKEEEYKNQNCSVANEIIKTQLITNIIWIGDKDFRYINFANYSNGDMILETTSNPGNSKRMFYGLKNNGEYLFKTEGKLTPYYSMKVSNQEGNNNTLNNESEFFIVKIKEDGEEKEYLISLSMYSHYFELYDFQNENISQITVTNFLQNTTIFYPRFAISNILIKNESFIILGFWPNIKDIQYKKILINTKNIENGTTINNTNIYLKNPEILKKYGKTISCFVTDSQYIIFFYYYGSSENIFAYYNFSSTYNISFPYIKIKYYDSTTKGFKDRFSSSIELNYNNIEFNLLFFSIVL